MIWMSVIYPSKQTVNNNVKQHFEVQLPSNVFTTDTDTCGVCPLLTLLASFSLFLVLPTGKLCTLSWSSVSEASLGGTEGTRIK